METIFPSIRRAQLGHNEVTFLMILVMDKILKYDPLSPHVGQLEKFQQTTIFQSQWTSTHIMVHFFISSFCLDNGHLLKIPIGLVKT